MVMRIDQSNSAGVVIFTLSGRIENEKITQLRQVLASQNGTKIAIDLKDVTLVDQDSVKFLAECEAHGVDLCNCPAYLREWILRVRTMNRI